jgi:hypothetical protein
MVIAAMTQVEPTGNQVDQQVDDQAMAEAVASRRRSKKKPLSIAALLTTATADLLWISETDMPFNLMQWPDKTIAEGSILDAITLQQWLNLPEETVVETCELTSFFAIATEAQDWHGEEEIAIVKRYQALVQLLSSSLQHCQVFRFGSINIDIYIIGQTSDKQWLGLHTQAVET